MTRPRHCMLKVLLISGVAIVSILGRADASPGAPTDALARETSGTSAPPPLTEPEKEAPSPQGTTAPAPDPTPATTPPAPREPGVPDVLIDMTPPGGGDLAYAVIVEKSTQRLLLYAYDGTFKKVMETDCSTGKSDGPKRVSGDSKTPEGIYFFNDVHEDKELSPIYGVKAFPTDYPNLLDRIAGFTGSAIWLHGTNKPLAPTDSNGCIVMENRELLKVGSRIDLHRTPIIIVDTLSYGDPEEHHTAKAAAAGFLQDWENALESGPYHAYLEHYAPAYLPDISWWNTWRRFREKYNAKHTPLDIDIRNVSIYRHDDIYVALFDESLKAPGPSGEAWPTGIRKLFMTYEKGRFAIIGDTYQILPEALVDRSGGSPLVAALTEAERARATDAKVAAAAPKVIQMVDKWLQAWSDKDIEAYGSYYSSDFRSDGRDKSAYLAYKDRLNRIYDYIRVERGDLSVEKGENGRLIASFVQKYRSSGHRTVGTKRLVLKEEKGGWKIYRETWHRK